MRVIGDLSWLKLGRTTIGDQYLLTKHFSVAVWVQVTSISFRYEVLLHFIEKITFEAVSATMLYVSKRQSAPLFSRVASLSLIHI